MNKLLSCLIAVFSILLSCTNIAHAQTPQHYVLHTGGHNYIPYNFTNNKAQWLYYPTEFSGTLPTSPQNITKVYVRAGSNVTNAIIPDLTIKIGTTNATAVNAANWITPLTTVYYEANHSSTAVADAWVGYTLQTPFLWDGVSNLVLEISTSLINAGGFTVHQGTLPQNRRLYGLANNANPAGTDGTQVSMGIDMAPAVCSGTPLGGVVAITNRNLPCGQSATINLVGSSNGGGITYEWERSIDNGATWNIFGTSATSANTGIIMTNTIYRCKVTCTPSNQSSYSAQDTIFSILSNVGLGNDTTLCLNANITLNANNNISGTYLWNTNATSPSINITQTGIYSVAVTQPNGCISNDTILVTTGIEPVNPLNTNYNLCEDSIVYLNALNPRMTYLWNTSATTDTISVRTAGNYSVTIKSRDNCENTFNTLLTMRPLPITNLLDEVSICIGDTAVLDATATNGNSYLWSNGSTSSQISVRDSGNYKVSIRSDYGCLIKDSAQVSYRPNPTIEGYTYIPRFYQELKIVDFAPINPQNVTQFHWDFGDGNTSGLRNPTHTYDTLGEYLVTLTLSNNCNETHYSQTIRIAQGNTGINNNPFSKLLDIYPNPSKGNIYINNQTSKRIKSIIIYNSLGQIIHTKHGDTNALEINNHPKGHYILNIILENDESVRKQIIIN